MFTEMHLFNEMEERIDMFHETALLNIFGAWLSPANTSQNYGRNKDKNRRLIWGMHP